MKRFLPLFVSVASIIMAASVFGESANSTNIITIKVNGGWNTWLLGSAIASGASSVTGVSTGGLSFGVDALYGKRDGLQYGLGFAYLPLISATSNGASVNMSMMPLVAELFFNRRGPFYGDLGLGIAFLGATASSSALTSNSSTAYSPSPGVLAKVGLGFDFKVSGLIGIYIGADAYLPFTDFGITGGKSNAALDVIALSEFNLHLGADFSL